MNVINALGMYGILNPGVCMNVLGRCHSINSIIHRILVSCINVPGNAKYLEQ